MVFLVAKKNGAAPSEADGYYRTYSFGGRLDVGWRAFQCIGHYAASMRLMQAAWREVGVSLYALLRRAIARSDTRWGVRACTCVNSLKSPVCAFFSRFIPKDRKIGRTASSFEIFISRCGILRSWVQRVRSYVLWNFRTLVRKNYARTVWSCVYFEILYFELSWYRILKFQQNNAQNMFGFELLDTEVSTK